VAHLETCKNNDRSAHPFHKNFNLKKQERTKPWRQSQFSASFLTTSRTESISSAPSV
jgi:hypothetical protein